MVTKDMVYDAISTVIDPEIGFNLVELGLIYDAIIEDDKVKVVMTLSTKACPLHQMIVQWVREAVEKIDEVRDVEVELVWEPAWNITMATPEVQTKLSGF